MTYPYAPLGREIAFVNNVVGFITKTTKNRIRHSYQYSFCNLISMTLKPPASSNTTYFDKSVSVSHA